jgi:acetyltransferase-like isoleucine patch superfamily enzyme
VSALTDYLRRAIALARGAAWRSRRNVRAATTPLVLGSRCILKVAEGGSFRMGANCSFDRDVEIVVHAGGRLELGDHVYVGHGTTISCAQAISIGSETLIGDLVSIRDMNHRRIPGAPMRLSGIESRAVAIGANCWLGSKVTVVAGAQIGNDVTVAANAVVSGVVLNGELVGGVPARPLPGGNGGESK